MPVDVDVRRCGIVRLLLGIEALGEFPVPHELGRI